jgi:serine/threonine protein kinase
MEDFSIVSISECRFILINKKQDNFIYKVRLVGISETNIDNIIQKLQQFHLRFEFWKRIKDIELCKRMILYIDTIYGCKKTKECFVSNNRGVDLQTIISLKICKFQFIEMCYLLRHLVESLQILSMHGISHRDFRYRNIVMSDNAYVNPTGSHSGSSEGPVISNQKTLPIIIDFGDSKCDTIKNSMDENIHSFYLFVQKSIESKSFAAISSSEDYVLILQLLQKLEKVESFDKILSIIHASEFSIK